MKGLDLIYSNRILEMSGLVTESTTTSLLIKEFTKAANKLKKDYETWIHSEIEKEIEDFKAKARKEPSYHKASDLVRKHFNNWKFPYVVLSVLNQDYGLDGKRDSRVYGKPGFSPQTDVDYVVNREVKRASDNMHDSFIAKNIAKFTGILKDHAIKKINIDLKPNLTGIVSVKCNDGSGFNARFQITHNYSSKGTFFQKFPTTFHNVVLANGEKMKSPSEKKLKDNF